MADRVQTYKSHTRLLPAFHFFVIPVLAGNVLVAIRHLWRLPTLGMGWQLIVALALLTLGFLARTMALTVQDRLIRLEMRLRLREVLPPELQPKIPALTHRQLIALRFASDDELPVLVREISDGRLQTAKDIKMRVKNWQADWLRV